MAVIAGFSGSLPRGLPGHARGESGREAGA